MNLIFLTTGAKIKMSSERAKLLNLRVVCRLSRG
jgi:hypothetical protein